MLNRITMIGLLLLPIVALSQPQGPDTLWTQTIFGSGSIYIQGVATQPNGDIYSCGTAFLPDSPNLYAGLVMRFNGNGERHWSRMYDSSGVSGFITITCTSDGGAIAAGFGVIGDFRILKIDSSGGVVWNRATTLTASLFPAARLLINEAGYLLVQSGGSTSFEDILLSQYDQSGDTLWTHRYGGRGLDWSKNILAIGDGYLLAGSVSSQQSEEGIDPFLMRLDSRGGIVWSRSYACPQDEWINGLISFDSTYALCGWSENLSNNSRYLFSLTVNDNGDSLRSRTYEELGQGTYLDYCQYSDSAYVACGSAGNQIRAIFVDNQENIHWLQDYRLSQVTIGYCVAKTQPGNLAFGGATGSGAPPFAGCVLLTGPALSMDYFRYYPIATTFDLGNYPNPFNAITTISFTLPKTGPVDLNVYEVTGRLVRCLAGGCDSPLQAGTHDIAFDGGDLPSGIYFVRMEAGGVAQTEKIVLLK